MQGLDFSLNAMKCKVTWQTRILFQYPSSTYFTTGPIRCLSFNNGFYWLNSIIHVILCNNTLDYYSCTCVLLLDEL